MPVPSFLLEQRELEVQQALNNLLALPNLTRSEVGNEESCPICLLTLESILEEHISAEEKKEGTSYLPSDNAGVRSILMTGVVKLTSCRHIFCRKDLAEWIESHHGSCPTCRRKFFEFTPLDEADYESSDGGEYVPDEDDGYTDYDDFDIDVVTTSDFDYEMDDETSAEDEDDGEVGYVPLARVRAAVGSDVSYSAVDHTLQVYAPNPSDDSYWRAEIDADGGTEDVGELSYGSDSPSSGGASSNAEDIPNGYTVDISIASDARDTAETSSEVSKHIQRFGTKSPMIQAPDLAESTGNVAR